LCLCSAVKGRAYLITPSTCWETRTEDKRTRTRYKRLETEEAREHCFTVRFPVKRQSQKFIFRLNAMCELQSNENILGKKEKKEIEKSSKLQKGNGS
jgi:hypothetical protein